MLVAQRIESLDKKPHELHAEVLLRLVNEDRSFTLPGQSVGDRAFHSWANDLFATVGPSIRSKLCLEITETAAVTNLADAAINEAAVRCFADVARVMGLKTVAEFVGEPAVRERLREMGIDYGQGFLFHRPAPIDALSAVRATVLH